MNGTIGCIVVLMEEDIAPNDAGRWKFCLRPGRSERGQYSFLSKS